MTRVTVLNTAQEMRDIAVEWDDALSALDVSECSLTSHWITCWLTAFDPDGQAMVLCVRDAAGAIVGQAAFTVQRARGFSVLRSLSNTYATRTTVAGTPAGRAAIAQWIARRPEPVIRLERCPADAGCATLLPHAVTAQRFELPVIDTDLSYDAYLSARSANFRKSLKRARKSHAGLDITCVPARPEHAADILAVSRKTWKFEEGTAIASDPGVSAFYTGLLTVDAASHAAQPFVTLVRDTQSGDPVAFLMGLIHRGTMFALKMGYDPRIQERHPGFALLQKCVETACAAPDINALDLDALGPHGDYKRRWATRIETLESIVAFQKTPLGWLARHAYDLKGVLRFSKDGLSKRFGRKVS